MKENHIICKILGGVDKVYEYLYDYLSKNNIHAKNLRFLNAGESSIVFETDDLIIKITRIRYFDKEYKPVTLTEYTKDSEFISKPIKEETIIIGEEDIVFYAQEKLTIEDISPKDLYIPYKHLKDDQYVLSDLRADNFGVDSEGKIVLHDYGQLFNARMYKKEKMQQIELYHQTRWPEYAITYEFEKNGIKEINGIDIFDIIKLISYDIDVLIFLHLNRESKEEKEKMAKSISTLITLYINDKIPFELNLKLIFRSLDIIMKYEPIYYLSLVPKVKIYVGARDFESGKQIYKFESQQYNLYIDDLKKEDHKKTKKKTS